MQPANRPTESVRAELAIKRLASKQRLLLGSSHARKVLRENEAVEHGGVRQNLGFRDPQQRFNGLADVRELDLTRWALQNLIHEADRKIFRELPMATLAFH